MNLERSLSWAALLCLLMAGEAVHAEPQSKTREWALPADAAEHRSPAPAASTERAAEALNERDVQEIEKRRRGGDDDPETRDGVRIQSTPDHRGENDGKP